MKKIIPKKIKSYWRKLEKENLFMCPNITMFRLLAQNKLNFKGKNVLDIGFGEGQNISEFRRRGANIYGIELRKEKVKKVIKELKIESKNFYECDLNEDYPKLKVKFNFVYTLDTLNYIKKDRHSFLINKILENLKIGGFFLLHYPQVQLVKKNKIDLFSYYLDSNNYKKRKIFVPRSNPVLFLSNSHIKHIIKKFSKKLKLVSSIFDTGTFSKKDSSNLTINRFLLFKKIN